MTPLGVPVEPLVYCRKAKLSDFKAGLSQLSAKFAFIVSVAINFSDLFPAS